MKDDTKKKKSKRKVKRSWCTKEPKYYKNPHDRIFNRGTFRENKSEIKES